MATNPAAPQYEGESEDAAKGSTSPPSTPRGASPTDEVDPDASGSVAKGAASAAPIRDENLDDSDPGASAAANPQRSGVAVLSMAAAFDTAVPEEVVNANYNQFRARELHDPLAGMTDGSGSLRNFFLFMQGVVDENGNPRTEDDNDDDDGMSDYIEAANDREEQRHAREEWAQADHTFAGQTMSAGDWAAMKKWFDDPDNVAGWEQAMMAETGQSLAEVRQTGGKMRRFYELMDKQAQGKTLTTAEQTEFQTLNDDPKVRKGVQVQESRMEAGSRPSTDNEVRAQNTELRSESTDAGMGLIAARANLNAEPLTPIYNAVAAEPTQPKPNEATPGPLAAPVEIAAATTPQRPVAALNANLDMG